MQQTRHFWLDSLDIRNLPPLPKKNTSEFDAGTYLVQGLTRYSESEFEAGTVQGLYYLLRYSKD